MNAEARGDLEGPSEEIINFILRINFKGFIALTEKFLLFDPQLAVGWRNKSIRMLMLSNRADFILRDDQKVGKGFIGQFRWVTPKQLRLVAHSNSSSNLDLFWKHNIIPYYFTTTRKAVFHRAMFTLLRSNYETSTEPGAKISHDSLSAFGEVRTPFIIAKKRGEELFLVVDMEAQMKTFNQ